MEQICRGFKELGFTYYPSEANFVMVDIGQPAEPVFVNMLKKGVIVRSGHALGLPNGLRITIGNEEQNRRMLDVLAESVRR